MGQLHPLAEERAERCSFSNQTIAFSSTVGTSWSGEMSVSSVWGHLDRPHSRRDRLFSASPASPESEIFNHVPMGQTRDHLDARVIGAIQCGLLMKWNHNLSTHFLNHNLSNEDRDNGKSQNLCSIWPSIVAHLSEV
jgi:hypothetical protein